MTIRYLSVPEEIQSVENTFPFSVTLLELHTKRREQIIVIAWEEGDDTTGNLFRRILSEEEKHRPIFADLLKRPWQLPIFLCIDKKCTLRS